MPIIINEIVIKTTIEETPVKSEDGRNDRVNVASTTDVVQQAVEKVMEILAEKEQR